MRSRRFLMLLLLLAALALSACRDRERVTPITDDDGEVIARPAAGAAAAAPETDGAVDASAETPEPTVAPSPTPQPAKNVTVCLSQRPEDVYLYGDTSPAAVALRHAIYENLFTTPGYAYQALGLEKMPSLADGDAFVQLVNVFEGDTVTDVTGAVAALVPGVAVFNAAGEVVEFTGEPIQMPQLVVNFTFKPLVWSDGTPVTAADSVFSFNVAADPATPGRKATIAHTASYEASDERSVRWTGIPGYLDINYATNVWMPLPDHHLEGLTPRQMLDAPETNQTPLSSGPFVIESWPEDGDIVLAANPEYYRAAEGLPRIDTLTLRFVSPNEVGLGETLGAGCDVITDDVLAQGSLPALQEAEAAGEWVALVTPGPVFEHIDFGINPVSEYAEGRPDWFEDVRVRQAITMCTDRERMRNELTEGQAQMLDAYVPPDHPLYPAGLQSWPYDPDRANALLDEAGYVDFAGDGRRQDVASGVPMTVTLGTNNENALRVRINEIVQENLQACGIPVELYTLPAGTWFADGPQGRLFGRQFDLGTFGWISRIEPDCGLFLTGNIPGPREFGFGGWRNVNVSGYSNEAYDAACKAALTALPGGPGYVENQQEALRIFSEELPVIPLFTNVRVAAARPGLENVAIWASQPSLLWNVAEWDLAPPGEGS